MAESLLQKLGGGLFRAYSAGSHPVGEVNSLALNMLERNRFPTSQARSKNWEEFALPDAPVMDFVLTVCDKAAGEVCPLWPGQPMSAHWGVPDPVVASAESGDGEKSFLDTFMVLNRRISLFVVLPFEKLDRLALQRQVAAIGSAQPD